MSVGLNLRRQPLRVLILALAAALLVAAWGCGEGGSKGGSQAPPQSAVSYDPKRPLVLQFGRAPAPGASDEPILAELAAEYRGKLNVSEVSVEEQEALAERAGVRFLPTIIIYRPGGQELYRHVGFWPKEEMVAKLRELGLIAEPRRRSRHVEKALIATELPSGPRRAAGSARRGADRLGGQRDRPGPRHREPRPGPLAKELLETETDLLREREARLRGLGLQTRAFIDIGPPGEVLRQLCEKENPGLVVMGSHGKGLWKRAWAAPRTPSCGPPSGPCSWCAPPWRVRRPRPASSTPRRSSSPPTSPTTPPPPCAASATAGAQAGRPAPRPGARPHRALPAGALGGVQPHRRRAPVSGRGGAERGRGAQGGAEIELGDATGSILEHAKYGNFTLLVMGLRGAPCSTTSSIGSVAANLSLRPAAPAPRPQV